MYGMEGTHSYATSFTFKNSILSMFVVFEDDTILVNLLVDFHFE